MKQPLHQIENKIKTFYSNLNKKNRRTIRMLPRVALMMMFTVYFSGLLQSTIDVFFMLIGVLIIGVILFFIPIEKVLFVKFRKLKSKTKR